MLLFVKMTASLTFSCPSAAYMDSFLVSSACHSSPSFSQHDGRLFPWSLSPPYPFLFFHLLVKSLCLNLPQLSEMSALTMPLLLPIASLLSSFNTAFPLLFLHSSPVFLVNAVVASDLVTLCFNWKQLFLRHSCFLPPHSPIYLHLTLVPASLGSLSSAFLLSSACLISVHFSLCPCCLFFFHFEKLIFLPFSSSTIMHVSSVRTCQ